MRLHSFGCNAEVPGDFLVGLALADQLENVAFACTQRFGNHRRRARQGSRLVAVVPACDETAEMGEELSEKTGAFGILLEAHQQGADRRALIKNGLTNAGRCGRTQNPAKGIQGYGRLVRTEQNRRELRPEAQRDIIVVRNLGVPVQLFQNSNGLRQPIFGLRHVSAR